MTLLGLIHSVAEPGLLGTKSIHFFCIASVISSEVFSGIYE
jgi:hypothetical protein